MMCGPSGRGGEHKCTSGDDDAVAIMRLRSSRCHRRHGSVVRASVISQTLPESPRYSRVIPESFLYDPRVIPEYSQVLSSIPKFPKLNPSWSTYLLIPE